MRRNNIVKGREGEELAVRFLQNKGYKVIERNYQTRFGEIDVICRKKGRVVFVEVKSKTGAEFGEPWEMVNKRKLSQVKRMAKFWLAKKGLGEVKCRIDVVGVWLNTGKVEHWENVEG